MTDDRTPGEPSPIFETRQQAQLRLLQARYGDITPGPATWERDGTAFHYRSKTLLIRDEFVSQVRTRLAGTPIEVRLDPGDRTYPGVTVAQVSDVNEALRVINEGVGFDAAAPDHLVHICPPTGVGGNCPASEPIPVPLGTPPSPDVNRDKDAGQGVRVVVADTGLDPSAEKRTPWLAGVTGDVDLGTLQNPMTEYAGHGTFIAGVVRCMAPAAEVHVRATFGIGGAVFETALLDGLIDILDNDYPDIISLSAGTWTHASRDLLTMQLFGRRRLRLHKGVLLVAAAGNDNQRWPFWPAAAPYAVSVGALDKGWIGKAQFSNFGHWVDAYAPGDDLVNAFPAGVYIGQEEGNKGVEFKYEGMARWSGTSFATPLFAGMTAARMSTTGENGVDAAARLLKLAQKRAIPGLGAAIRPNDSTIRV
jgi:hypothetical protein